MKRDMTRCSIWFGLFVLTSLMFLACGPATPGDPSDPTGQNQVECGQGERCLCTGTCTRTCPKGGCKFYCSGSGTCNLSCDGGKCEVTLTGEATANLSCKGGNCEVLNTSKGKSDLACSGNNCEMLCAGKEQECNITECTSGCKLQCYPGNPKCNNTCKDPSCK